MADIEIGPLGDHLDEDEIDALAKALEKVGAPRLPKTDDGAAATIAGGLDEDVLAEFMDRLEAHDIACEVYLPVEFEGRVELFDLRVGSAAVLLDVLEELQDDFGLAENEDEDEDEDDEDDDREDEDDDEEEDDHRSEIDLVQDQLRQVWKLMVRGATAALERKLPLYVQGD
jgi:hypothetical protein